MPDAPLVPVEVVESRIVRVRGQKVILDADLAELYGVPTKRLNEQVRRNADRFPGDFMFRLTAIEKAEVVANCDHLSQLRFSPALPIAFTEHGALMAASVLNSTQAVQTSILVVRAFVRMRQMIGMVSDLAQRLDRHGVRPRATPGRVGSQVRRTVPRGLRHDPRADRAPTRAPAPPDRVPHRD